MDSSEHSSQSNTPEPEDTNKTEQTRQPQLLVENQELRRLNQRLLVDVEELTNKLESELSKHNNSLELANCQKLLQLHAREIKSLRRQVLSEPQTRLQELSSVLKGKDQ